MACFQVVRSGGALVIPHPDMQKLMEPCPNKEGSLFRFNVEMGLLKDWIFLNICCSICLVMRGRCIFQAGDFQNNSGKSITWKKSFSYIESTSNIHELASLQTAEIMTVVDDLALLAKLLPPSLRARYSQNLDRKKAWLFLSGIESNFCGLLMSTRILGSSSPCARALPMRK